MRKYLALLTLALPLWSFAQDNSTVSGTIVDTDTITWANGSWSATLANPQGGQAIYIDTKLPVTTTFGGSLDGSGHFSQANMANNAAVFPGGTFWLFTFCPRASFHCTQLPSITLTSNLDISSQATTYIMPPRFAATGTGAYGYSDVEINVTPIPGGSYYNVTTPCWRIWSGSSWSCSSTGGSFTAGGDLSGSNTSQEVVGILSNVLPSLATGYLNWTGTAWAFSTPASITLGTTGQIPIMNAGATAYAPVTLSQDCTITSLGVITCLKTNNVAFTSAATTAIGTSGATIPLLNGANTHSGASIFSAAGAASTPGVTVSGTPYTGGNGTTNTPQFYLNQGGTGPTGFSTSGTEFGINAPSGFLGNFFDAWLNGSHVALIDIGGNYWVKQGGCFVNLTSSNTGKFCMNSTGPTNTVATASIVGLTVNNSNASPSADLQDWQANSLKVAWVDSTGGYHTNTTMIAAGIYDGESPITLTTVSSCTLGTASGCNTTAYNSGYTFNQEATAATAVTYTLPTAAAGKQYCVSNSYNGSAATTGVLEIATSASGQFIIFTDGTLSATGGNVTSGGAAGDAACVVGISTTQWQLYVQRGTWTKH